MNLVLLFILVSCGSLGAVMATVDENIVTDELTEKIERLETENQDLMTERDELKRAHAEELHKKIILQEEKDKLIKSGKASSYIIPC